MAHQAAQQPLPPQPTLNNITNALDNVANSFGVLTQELPHVANLPVFQQGQAILQNLQALQAQGQATTQAIQSINNRFVSISF